MKYADENSFNEVNVFGRGEFNKEYAQYFIGNSYLNPLSLAGEPKIFVSNVTFEPGCRNNWHIHHDPALAYCRRGLFKTQRGRPCFHSQLVYADGNRTGRYQYYFITHILNIGQDTGKAVKGAQVALADFIRQRRCTDFDYNPILI